MPIDWEMIARAFRLPMAAQLHDLNLIFERLAKWLEKRLKQAELLERRSVGFPILRFRDEALTMYVAPHQKEAVHAAPSIGDIFSSAGRKFIDGITYTKTAVDEALLLVELVGSLAKGVGIIKDSIDKFAIPRPQLFNPDERTASDLFGIAALGFRAVAGSLDQIEDAALQVAFAQAKLGEALAGGAAGGAGEGAGGGGEPRLLPSLAESLDGVARQLLAGILIVPALGPLIEGWIAAVDQLARRESMKMFDKIERAVFALRRSIFELFFAELPALLEFLSPNVTLLNLVIAENLTFFFAVAKQFLDELFAQIVAMADDIRSLVDFGVGFTLSLLDWGEKVGNLDAGPILNALFFAGLPGGLLGTLLPGPFKIRDLIGPANQLLKKGILEQLAKARVALYAAKVGRWLTSWGPLVIGDQEDNLKKLDLVEQIVIAAFPKPLPRGRERSSKAAVAGLADISATVLDPAVAALAPLLATTQTTFSAEIKTIFDSAGDGLLKLQVAFNDAAAESVRLGLPAGFEEIARQAELHGGEAFGGQIAELEKRIAARAEDPVADAFERWLSGEGAFDLIGRAIPAYVAEMDRFWREQKGTPREPSVVLTDQTSPHILARRAVRLKRVQLKEMKLLVKAEDLDAALAAHLAGQFREQVEAAYAAGRDKLVALHAAARGKAEAERAAKKRIKGKGKAAPRAVAPAATPGAP